MNDGLKGSKLNEGFLDGLLDSDRPKVLRHARWKGVKKYEFSKEEFQRLRTLAYRIHMKREVIEQFERSFEFMYLCQMWMRKGTFNSICGMGFDGAVLNYGIIAATIEKKKRNAKLVCTFS